MKGINHLSLNFFFFICIYCILLYKDIIPFNLLFFCIDILAVIIFSILPDLDSRTSIIRKISILIIFTMLTIFIMLLATTNNMLYIIFALFVLGMYCIITLLKHRGIMHNMIFGIVICLPILYLSIEVFIIACSSYLMHIIEDKISDEF